MDVARRRVRIEHVDSSVKRCRMVHDTNRRRKAGFRDLVMEVCVRSITFVCVCCHGDDGLIGINYIFYLVESLRISRL